MRLGRKQGCAVIGLATCITSACHRNVAPPPAPVPAQQQAPQQEQPTQSSTTATHPPARKPRPSTPTDNATPPPTPAPVPAQPQPEFRLGQALTPEEQRSNSALIDEHIRNANRALGAIGNRALTSQQKATVDQIKGFISQAQQMRSTNLVGARSLAERADVLANNLLQNLK